MERVPMEVTRQDRIYCLKASSDYHSEVCEECKAYPNCDHMTQDDMTELTIKDLEALEQQEPCEDAVSRKELMGNYNSVETPVGYRKVVDMEVIKNMPPVTPIQRWIPTSERQPEANSNYLAFYRSSDGTATLEFMMVDHCNADGDWLHEESGRKSYRKVIAWMPLPEPYKAEMEIE